MAESLLGKGCHSMTFLVRSHHDYDCCPACDSVLLKSKQDLQSNSELTAR